MKLLLLSLFLLLSVYSSFSQDHRIIFPLDKIISHDDSMGIILIDHIYHGRREKAVEMLKNGKVGGHVRDINGFYAIEYAMERFDTNMISLLIEKGATLENGNGGGCLWFDVNNRKFNRYNYVVIIEGGTCGWLPNESEKYYSPDTLIADYLLRKHVKTLNSSKSRRKMTDFYTLNGYLNMTKKFIDRGVIFSDSFKIFDSPIIAACLSGNYELFKLFVDKGFSFKDETIDGRNALHYACLGGESRIIHFLIGNGVDLTKIASYSDNWENKETPISTFQCFLIGRNKSPEIIQYFFDHGFKLVNSDYWFYLFNSKWYLTKSEWKDKYRIVQILLENGVSPNFEGDYIIDSKKFYNSLMLMSSNYLFDDDVSLEFCKLFISYGLNLTYVDLYRGFDSFEYLIRSRDYGPPDNSGYEKTVDYLASICPYYTPLNPDINWYLKLKNPIPYNLNYRIPISFFGNE